MTLQTIAGTGLMWPPSLPLLNTLGTTTFALTATGHKYAAIVRIPVTGNITTVSFMTGTVTTSDTLSVGLETVDATTGDPSGTAYGGSVPGTVSGLATNTIYEVTLGTQASATAGDYVAIVIKYNSYVAGNLQIRGMDNTATMPTGLPYNDLFTTAWVKDTDATPIVTLGYSGSYYDMGALGTRVPVSTTFSSSSTPDEIGNKFTLPWPVRVSMFVIWIDADGAVDIVLYDSDGTTALATVSIDDNIRGSANNARYVLPLASKVSLVKDTAYRLVVKPTTTTGVNIKEITAESIAMLDQLPGGRNCFRTSRTDAGAWTDTATTVQIYGLSMIFDQVDDGVGGGGVIFVSTQG